jgi:hypothetical protein
VNTAFAAQATAANAAADALNKVTVAASAAATAQAAAADSTRKSGSAAAFAYGGWFRLWGLLGRKVTLFGGVFGASILGAVGSVHLLMDAVFEFLAVWIPASLAFGAWGLAASDAIREVVTRMQDLHTVTDATGRTIAPMTGAWRRCTTPCGPVCISSSVTP